jgi:hypothetical protein
MLHLIGHLFHNLSDLHVNLLDTPPRNICCMTPQTAMISAITDVGTATSAPPNSTNNAFMESSTSRLNSTTPNNNSNPNLDATLQQHHNIHHHTHHLNIMRIQPASGYFINNSQINPNPSPADSTQQTPNRAANNSIPFNPFNSTLRNPFARTNQQRGDPYLLCNSVHFLNSSINQSLNASSGMRDLNNSMAHPNRVNISNNMSQRRRHPAGNHVNEQVNVNNQANDFSRIVGEMLTPLIQNGGVSQISVEASINSFGKWPLSSLISI